MKPRISVDRAVQQVVKNENSLEKVLAELLDATLAVSVGGFRSTPIGRKIKQKFNSLLKKKTKNKK